MKFLEYLRSKLKVFHLKGRLSFAVQAQNSILSAALILGISSGITAVLGLLKGRLLSYYFGVSEELGIFYTADRIPNLIYSVLVIGAISTVFIPVFTDTLQKDKKRAWKTASSVVSIGVLTFFVLGILVIVFAKPIISLLSVGTFTPEQVALGASLMRIMIGAQLILVISSFFTSILQSFKQFTIPALAPILYNLGMLFGIMFLSPVMGIYGPAVGIVIGSMFHLLIQLPFLKNVDFRYSPSLNVTIPEVRKMFLLMPPRIMSVLFSQLVATINNSLAILISTSSVVLLKFASQLQFFPVHLFGASIATASLPVLSEHSDATDMKNFKKIFITTLHQTLFLVIPTSVILLVLRVPVVRLVYGVSNFPWEATVKTSYALAFFSLSIFAQSTFYLLSRTFYSLKDTVTPVLVSLITIIVNVSLSYTFVRVLELGVWSIAFAYTITSILDVMFLMYFLSKKLGGFSVNELMIPFVKMSYAALFMGISLYMPLKFLDEFVFDTTHTAGLAALTGMASLAGVVSYLFFTKIFDVEEIELFYKLLRRLKLKDAAVPLTATIED